MSFISSITPLRVHVSPVGFEVDRIVLPAIRMKADRVWLIVHSNSLEDKGIHFLRSIKSEFEKNKIEFKEERADRTDLFDTLRAFRSILAKENGNNVLVNVSAGSKIQAIASMLACMMFKKISKIKPYYVIPERYASTMVNQETEGVRDIVPLPEYEIEIPSHKLVHCLSLIHNERNEEITKKRLKDLALKDELIHVEREKDEKSKELSAFMSLNKNLIQPLLAWNFIEVNKVGGAHRINLTTEGKNVLKFLGNN